MSPQTGTAKVSARFRVNQATARILEGVVWPVCDLGYTDGESESGAALVTTASSI